MKTRPTYLLLASLLIATPVTSSHADSSCNFSTLITRLFRPFTSPQKVDKDLQIFLVQHDLRHLTADEYMARVLKVSKKCIKPFSTCKELFSSGDKERFLEILEVSRKIQDGTILEWANTKDRITFVYQLLPDFPKLAPKILAELKKSPLLIGVDSPKFSPNTLLTYSFEKEGRDPKISFFYRLPEYTDDQWLELKAEDRLEKLFIASEKELEIVSTQFKPKSLGEFTKELDQIRNREVVGEVRAYEVKHHDFELSMKDHLKAVAETGNELDYSNLHTHIVFEIPKNYPEHKTEAYFNWQKHQNDYALFKGMEEGLHPNWLTRAATRKASFESGNLKESIHLLPSKFSSINETNYKFMGVALRANIYGNPVSEDFYKIGIEIRDVSRKKEVYESFVKHTAESVEQERWLNLPEKHASSFEFEATRSFGIKQLLNNGIDDGFSRKLYASNPFVALPLNTFEQGKYLDYASGKWITVSSEKAQQITKAKNKFVKAMQDLQREYYELAQKKTPVSDDEVATVIKMCLSDWAKEAKISELYSK